MSNFHYITFKPPILERRQFNKKPEQLAEALFHSGKVRIDAINRINFVKLNIAGFNQMMTFSQREISDNKLFKIKLAELEAILGKKLKNEALSTKSKELINFVKAEMKKQIPVNKEEERKICRLIVQSSHPILTRLILLEGTEIFISYEHYIGDMLDMEGWSSHGRNSGMQASDMQKSTIYISCGGDPLMPEKQMKYEGDGLNAAARFLVIAAQEIGHYADIIRDNKGRYIGRYSANLYGTKPSKKAKEARDKDIERVNKLEKYLVKTSFEKISELEKGLKFLNKHRKFSAKFFTSWAYARFRLYIAILRLHAKNLHEVATISAISKYFDDLRGRRVSATKIIVFVKDMQANLSPNADVYKREKALEEEAIACIEALARVPQQVNKWGYRAVKFATPNLYKLYYKEVIPGCIKAYQNLKN